MNSDHEKLKEILKGVSKSGMRSQQRLADTSLGYAVPDPLPYFVLTKQGELQAREVTERMRLSNRVTPTAATSRYRVIGWYGPPGTGKDTLAREIAACLGMPFVEFDLGQGYDLLELIGGTGLRGRDGATETVAVEGPLTTAAKAGCMIALNEVVNLEGIQMSVLHALIQDRIVVLPTSEPIKESGGRSHRELSVDPRTFFVFTWNPDIRNPERQMPPPALLDRMRARRFDPDTEDDEKRKLSAMLSYTLDRDIGVEAITKDVRLIHELREAYGRGELDRCPYMRTLEDFALTRLTLKESAAFSTLLNLCNQDPEEFAIQRECILRHFRPMFGSP